jgi:hypothetical protein
MSFLFVFERLRTASGFDPNLRLLTILSANSIRQQRPRETTHVLCGCKIGKTSFNLAPWREYYVHGVDIMLIMVICKPFTLVVVTCEQYIVEGRSWVVRGGVIKSFIWFLLRRTIDILGLNKGFKSNVKQILRSWVIEGPRS